MGLPRICRPNRLAFPGNRRPGFDPSHPASQKIRLAAIPAGNNFVNLLNAKIGSFPQSIPSAALFGSVGPTVFAPGAVLYQVDIGAGPSETPSAVTMAAIIVPLSDSYILSTDNGNGVQLFFSSNTLSTNNWNGGTTSTGLTVSYSGVPYFVAASWNASSGVALVRNLLTGQITSNGSFSSVGFASDSGTARLGSPNFHNFVGYYGPMMFNAAFTPLPALLAWADDPWSFWYPPAVERLLFSGLASGGGAPPTFNPAWARGCNVINGVAT